MVSLINFKIVNEDLQRDSQQQREEAIEHGRAYSQVSNDQLINSQQPSDIITNNDKFQQQIAQKHNNLNQINNLTLQPLTNKPFSGDNLESKAVAVHTTVDLVPNFVVTWRNLEFLIEPKWHQKLMTRRNLNSMNGLSSGKRGAQKQTKLQDYQSSLSDQQQAQAAAAVETKIVLDKLDGSFRSGELTAILGPSGAGKTTLLDCLTGHRKYGLSGSIRISSACSSPATSSLSNKFEHNDNLKVSIIPQNDHLMGHLTVYETLNYASKMKNCFEKKSFNHQLNIKRIAQQLGLLSCLDTRVNKLSGGQYKRVSIAQELLSSPDILILDEPTSGLDAMTCYQTVQALKRLTDSSGGDRQLDNNDGAAEQQLALSNKQIAVILTIHQPNSDVFQQFNHVYVVAQGGKCIYEGSPASIEAVINRIGLRLPNSYYNPATMIVEIAAGKFGIDSINKLNSIQKKQYDYVTKLMDEQNSTGDSAVDCLTSSPSSSSSSASSLSSSFSSNDEDDADHFHKSSICNKKQQQADASSNNNRLEQTGAAGLINKGFVMDGELIKSGEPTNNINKDVIVILPRGAQDDDYGDDTDSLDKIKMNNNNNESIGDNNNGNNNEGRRKKRRRTRRRSNDQQSCGINSNNILASDESSAVCCTGATGRGGAGGDGDREKRLKLNSLKADQKFPFWRHTYLHFHRSWLSIIRDPMLCSMQLALHIIVPVMVSLVYGTNVGKPNACPRAGPMDIMAYALEPTDSALQLQEDLRTTLENIGYIFFKLYGIIFAAMTVTVLTFPLDMHVLVKEFRNGWYGLSSYFLGRTLADIPFQLTLPFLAMSLSYYATGQPYSYFQWRFLSITGILILSSLIAQSQGLLFGAILMDKMKAAVFVAPAATTPIILFAGFLVRTQSIPRYLRPLSNLSYLRYAIEACLISRYGFNQCECDPEMFNQTVPELPPIARSMLDYWLSSFKTNANNLVEHATNDTTPTTNIETTTIALHESSPDLFGKLMNSLARANSFGRNITSCEQVVPYPMIDYDLKDSQLFNCFAILLFMLIFTRFLTFFIVCFKVKRKV